MAVVVITLVRVKIVNERGKMIMRNNIGGNKHFSLLLQELNLWTAIFKTKLKITGEQR